MAIGSCAFISLFIILGGGHFLRVAGAAGDNLPWDVSVKLRFPVDYSIMSSSSEYLLPEFDIRTSPSLFQYDNVSLKDMMTNTIVSFQHISTNCQHNGMFCPSGIL